jgi:hypothetical protein
VPRINETYAGKNMCQEQMELMQVRICANSKWNCNNYCICSMGKINTLSQ